MFSNVCILHLITYVFFLIISNFSHCLPLPACINVNSFLFPSSSHFIPFHWSPANYHLLLVGFWRWSQRRGWPSRESWPTRGSTAQKRSTMCCPRPRWWWTRWAGSWYMCAVARPHTMRRFGQRNKLNKRLRVGSQAVVAGIQQAHAEQLANMRIQDLNVSLKPLNSVNNPILRKRKLLGWDGFYWICPVLVEFKSRLLKDVHMLQSLDGSLST